MDLACFCIYSTRRSLDLFAVGHLVLDVVLGASYGSESIEENNAGQRDEVRDKVS